MDKHLRQQLFSTPANLPFSASRFKAWKLMLENYWVAYRDNCLGKVGHID